MPKPADMSLDQLHRLEWRHVASAFREIDRDWTKGRVSWVRVLIDLADERGKEPES